MLTSIHHVQLAMPCGNDDRARVFYGTILGLTEVAKPPELAKRGGVWFEDGDMRVHLGVEDPFFPARKAHPAFEVDDLEALANKLEAADIPVKRDSALPDYTRFYTEDPFGNRIEFLQSS